MTKISAPLVGSGQFLIDDKPYQRGEYELIISANNSIAICRLGDPASLIVAVTPLTEWVDDADAPFANLAAFIAYVSPIFFFTASGGGGGGGGLTNTELRASPIDVNIVSGTEVAGVAGLSAINIDLLTNVVNGWYDARAFQSGSVQIVASAGISAGAIIFEQTNDPTSATGIPLLAQEMNSVNTNPINAATTIAANTNRLFRFGVNSGYVRVRISTAFVGGTVRAFGFFSEFPFSSPIVNVQQATAANLQMIATGSAAQGSAASGNPVFVGGVAKTAQATARTDGQMVAALYDKLGRHVMAAGSHIRDLRDMNAMVTLTATTETTIAAAVASTFNDLEKLIITNTSATDVRVDFRDTTAGTVRFSVLVKAASTVVLEIDTYKQATVNTNWTAQLSAAVTDVRITAITSRNI